ncbi:MAG: hypothetical protein WA728_23445 [Xanthobacteraceae bacterium]
MAAIIMHAVIEPAAGDRPALQPNAAIGPAVRAIASNILAKTRIAVTDPEASRMADKCGIFDARVSCSCGFLVASRPVIGFLLVGIFSAFTDGVQRSHLSRLVEDRYRGTAYGYLNAAVGFGALIAGVAGGFVWQQFGDTTALITGTSVIGVGLGVFSYDRIAMRERPSK